MQRPDLDRSSENWDRVQRLFERLMETDDTRALLAAEHDAAVAQAAEKLYRDHLVAEVHQFLDNPIMLVRDLNLGEAAPPDESMDLSGEMLSHFRILRKLGELHGC